MDTEAANTLAADAKVAATSSISLTAGSDLTVASSGLLEVNGDDAADARTITVSASESLTYAGPIGQALDTGDVAEIPATVTFTSSDDMDLSGAVIFAVDQITLTAGDDGSGSVSGDIGTQLAVSSSSSQVEITVGSASGAINFANVSLTAGERIQLAAAAGAVVHEGSLIAADGLEITAGGDVTANTSILTLTASLTGNGDLVLVNDRSLTTTSATNPSGSISLTAYGDLVATRVQTTGGEDQDDITLTLYSSSSVTAPALTLTPVSASLLGDVTISGPSSIVQTASNTIVADHLDVTVDGSLALATAINSMSGQATGSVDIDNSGSAIFTVTELTVADGSLSIDHPSGSIVLESVQLPSTRDANDLAVTVGSNIEVGNIRAGLYYATAEEADGETITALGDVILIAGGSITESGDDVAVDLVADQLTLSAETGINWP